eukprot:jgi/Botrbrau1/16574/Bobra.0068s0005.1
MSADHMVWHHPAHGRIAPRHLSDQNSGFFQHRRGKAIPGLRAGRLCVMPLHISRRLLSKAHSTGSLCCHPGDVLEKVDYSFYQGLPEEVITVEWLWETRLEGLLQYLEEKDRSKVLEALVLAYTSHKGQPRKSGEPYITHPVEVTRILAELKMDWESLAAGLLHDAVEDNPEECSFHEIQVAMNATVRSIVEGETKVSKSLHILGSLRTSRKCPPPPLSKDDDLKQLFLAFVGEIRVAIVKLADRLHNMRTLDSMPREKQVKIATETLEVFAPMAKILGLHPIKEELEELGFKYSAPNNYRLVRERMEQMVIHSSPSVEKARALLLERLANDSSLLRCPFTVDVMISQKSAYSVYRKLKKDKDGRVELQDLKNLQNVSQLIVVIHHDKENDPHHTTGRNLCYHVLGRVHQFWRPIPGMIKDYISTPKINGYQALHTTVLPVGAEGLARLECQIRSDDMHRQAMRGMMAHGWDAFASWKKKRDALKELKVSNAPADELITVKPVPNGVDTKPFPDPRLVFKKGGKRVNGNRRQPAAASQTPPLANGKAYKAGGSAGSMELEYSGNYLGVDYLKNMQRWRDELLFSSLPPDVWVRVFTEDFLRPTICVYDSKFNLVHIPKGSTIIDYAYVVGSGDEMVGAKINYHWVPVDRVLKEADVVDIVTSTDPPSAVSVSQRQNWLLYAYCESTIQKLNRYLEKHFQLAPPRTIDAEVQVKQKKIVDLEIECSNVKGMLATIMSSMSTEDYNIIHMDAKTAGNTCRVAASVEGDARRITLLRNIIRELPGVDVCTLKATYPCNELSSPDGL